MFNKKLSILILISFIFIVFFSCSKDEKNNLKREFSQPIHGKYQNWDEVFQNPSNITLTTFVTVKMMSPIGGTINLKHPNAKNINKEKIEIPVLSHLVQHEKYGNYLIDTGLDSSFQKNPHGKIKGLLKTFVLPSIIQETGSDIASELRKLNIDLKGVFFTHLHFDHVVGAADLADDIMYIAGKNESYINIRPLFYGYNFKWLKTLHEIDFSNSKNMSPFGPCVDVFGDGSLWAISTTGHTKGHTSYLVNGNDGAVLITGDACFHTLSIETGIGPGWYSSDIDKAQKSFDMIMEFHKKYPDVRLVFGHEIPKE